MFFLCNTSIICLLFCITYYHLLVTCFALFNFIIFNEIIKIIYKTNENPQNVILILVLLNLKFNFNLKFQ